MSDPQSPDGQEYVSKVDRRTALAWVGVVGAALAAGVGVVVYGEGHEPKDAKGYGTDPKLVVPDKAPWPRIMTPEQIQAAALIGDWILPASGAAPAASGLGIPDFINEWVSAPYPDQLKDRAVVLNGIEALRTASQRKHGVPFEKASAGQRLALLQDLPKSDGGKAFFLKTRRLVVGAYYTTPTGFKDIGYIGNVARASDPGPSAEAKAHVESALQQLKL